jgi:hypothetical protein
VNIIGERKEKKWVVQSNNEVVFLRILDGTRVHEFAMREEHARQMAGALNAAARHVSFQALKGRPGAPLIRKLA